MISYYFDRNENDTIDDRRSFDTLDTCVSVVHEVYATTPSVGKFDEMIVISVVSLNEWNKN